MTSLVDLESNQFVKMILLGEAGSGKTGALTSLVGAGYNLRILDFDNNVDPLAKFVKHEFPDKIGNVEFRTLTDKLKSSQMGPISDGMPTAFVEGIKMLDNWRYTDPKGKAVDLGPPAKWGSKCILVIDSLTFFSDAAFSWAEAMNPGAKDKRAIFFTAQQAIEKMLAMLKGGTFECHVIVLAHVRYETRQDGTVKGFPNSVGSALGPVIPAYFTSIAMMESTGQGNDVKRTIRTMPTAMIDLRNPAPFSMAGSLPIKTGLADFFKTVLA